MDSKIFNYPNSIRKNLHEKNEMTKKILQNEILENKHD